MHTPSAPAPLDLLSTAAAAAAPLPPEVLACLEFGARAPSAADPRIMPVPLATLGNGAFHAETWSSRFPVTTGSAGDIRFADNGEILFCWVHLPEARLADLEQASYQAHVDLHALMRARGFPHWLRAWNYLSRINEGEGDGERYRRFTAGRYRALAEVFAGTPQFDGLLPAATGVGTPGDTGLTIGFLAGRTPGIQVENPRQVSAFRYPRHYGPRSPSFSRATLFHWSDRATLFVSGTASIVGHATLHPGDAAAQFEETLCNLDALVNHAAREHAQGGFMPRSFKLYVRAPQHLDALGTRWREALATRAPTAVLLGDLCRADLLVEVEAVYERSP